VPQMNSPRLLLMCAALLAPLPAAALRLADAERLMLANDPALTAARIELRGSQGDLVAAGRRPVAELALGTSKYSRIEGLGPGRLHAGGGGAPTAGGQREHGSSVEENNAHGIPLVLDGRAGSCSQSSCAHRERFCWSVSMPAHGSLRRRFSRAGTSRRVKLSARFSLGSSFQEMGSATGAPGRPRSE